MYADVKQLDMQAVFRMNFFRTNIFSLVIIIGPIAFADVARPQTMSTASSPMPPPARNPPMPTASGKSMPQSVYETSHASQPDGPKKS